MEVEAYLHKCQLFRRLRSGPHGHLVERYAARLTEEGLVRFGTWRCLNVVGSLLSWIASRRYALTDLDEGRVERYLRYRGGRQSIQPGDRAALKRWLSVLRAEGAIAPSAAPQLTAHDRIFKEFEDYLRTERGSAPRSAICRRHASSCMRCALAAPAISIRSSSGTCGWLGCTRTEHGGIEVEDARKPAALLRYCRTLVAGYISERLFDSDFRAGSSLDECIMSRLMGERAAILADVDDSNAYFDREVWQPVARILRRHETILREIVKHIFTISRGDWSRRRNPAARGRHDDRQQGRQQNLCLPPRGRSRSAA